MVHPKDVEINTEGQTWAPLKRYKEFLGLSNTTYVASLVKKAGIPVRKMFGRFYSPKELMEANKDELFEQRKNAELLKANLHETAAGRRVRNLKTKEKAREIEMQGVVWTPARRVMERLGLKYTYQVRRLAKKYGIRFEKWNQTYYVPKTEIETLIIDIESGAVENIKTYERVKKKPSRGTQRVEKLIEEGVFDEPKKETKLPIKKEPTEVWRYRVESDDGNLFESGSLRLTMEMAEKFLMSFTARSVKITNVRVRQ